MKHARIFFLFLLIFLNIYSSPNPIFEITENAFGNPVVILPKECSQADLTQLIHTFEVSFFVDVPWEHATYVELLKQHDFSFYFGDNFKTRWVKRIDIDIPEVGTCVTSAKVIITREVDGIRQVLLTKEARKRNLSLPGGMVNHGEKALNTAVRELKEELNIDIEREKLHLVALINREKANEYSNAHHQYFFHMIDNGETINIDGAEILDIYWASLEQIKTGTIDNVHIPADFQLVIEALFDSPKSSVSFMNHQKNGKVSDIFITV